MLDLIGHISCVVKPVILFDRKIVFSDLSYHEYCVQWDEEVGTRWCWWCSCEKDKWARDLGHSLCHFTAAVWISFCDFAVLDSTQVGLNNKPFHLCGKELFSTEYILIGKVLVLSELYQCFCLSLGCHIAVCVCVCVYWSLNIHGPMYKRVSLANFQTTTNQPKH